MYDVNNYKCSINWFRMTENTTKVVDIFKCKMRFDLIAAYFVYTGYRLRQLYTEFLDTVGMLRKRKFTIIKITI